jgi:hypothetical protein
MPMPAPDSPPLHYLPPHLQEICALLARGLVRLRGDSGAEPDRDSPQAASRAESSLHFLPHRSGHANRKNRGLP